MKKFLVNISNVFIDVIIQGSLFMYYFMNNHNFILTNIIKFIPVFFIFILLCQVMNIIVVSAIEVTIEQDCIESLFGKDVNKEQLLSLVETFNKNENIFKKAYDHITDITLILLLILTGHPFCFIMFVMVKFLQKILKTGVKTVLENNKKEV